MKNKSWIISILIIILSYIVAIILYPNFPEMAAGHWNAMGKVDGYIPKTWALFLMPILSTVLLFFFTFIPKLDPYKENVTQFKKQYNGFILVMIMFLFYLYLLTIFWNLGFRFNFVQVLVPAFAGLFYYMGILVGHAKRNWFVGIRTPWTLSSEKVWNDTHKFGGKAFKYAGFSALLGLIFPNVAFWFVIIPVLGVSLYLFVYSYISYKNLKS